MVSFSFDAILPGKERERHGGHSIEKRIAAYLPMCATARKKHLRKPPPCAFVRKGSASGLAQAGGG